MIQEQIFRAYDIRGRYPDELDEASAEAIGWSIGSFARSKGERSIAVGRDGRLSSTALSSALVRGLVAAGMEVFDIGLATSPMLYFAATTLCSSGVEVTGSHNPKNHNGFKVVVGGRALYGPEIQALRVLSRRETPHPETSPGRASVASVLDAYIRRIVSDVALERPMRVAVDCGNGVAGASAPEVLRALGCDVVEINSEVDGNFPNHHPDPGDPANLVQLIEVVRVQGCELGLAFDGDGDRLGVVTAEGEVIFPDRFALLLIEDILAKHPGATIISDVKCSRVLSSRVRQLGGEPLMSPTGHSIIKHKMRETGSPFALELSGHMFFADRWPGFDDGTYAAARLLEILARSPNAAEVFKALPRTFATPEVLIACESPRRAMQELINTATFTVPAIATGIDGLRVDWPWGFALVRVSNTQNVLVSRFEGTSAQALARVQSEMMNQLRRVLPAAVVPDAVA